jgi:hypothetical protein
MEDRPVVKWPECGKLLSSVPLEEVRKSGDFMIHCTRKLK